MKARTADPDRITAAAHALSDFYYELDAFEFSREYSETGKVIDAEEGFTHRMNDTVFQIEQRDNMVLQIQELSKEVEADPEDTDFIDLILLAAQALKAVSDLIENQ